MERFRLVLLCCAASCFTGCYDASVDTSLEAVYACEVDSDCAAGFSCLLEVCTDGTTVLGPEISILGPEDLQVFPVDSSVRVPVVLRGSDLELQEPEGPNEPGVGHVEVRLDGRILDTLTTGNLGGGLQTVEFNVPPEAGLHRIEAVALRNDGSAYPNTSATAYGVFWVDDGREHIGFVKPPPNTRVLIGEDTPVDVEIATLNFTLVNPGLVPTDQLEASGQGHVHVFFNRSIPGCLPDCNFAYLSTGFPADGEGTNTLSVDAGALPTSTEGTFPLEVVAQNSAHSPYVRETTGDVVFDVVPLIVASE